MQELAAIKIIKNRLNHHFPNIQIYVEKTFKNEIFILIDDRSVYDSNEFLAILTKINEDILWKNGIYNFYFSIKYGFDKDAIPIEEYIKEGVTVWLTK